MKKSALFVTADGTKCTGCKACEMACFAAHNHTANGVGKTVGTVSVPVTPKLYLVKGEGFCLPIQCKHCEDAPCLNACPRDAIVRYDHQLIINTQKCQRCTNPVCVDRCPFGAIRLLPLPAKCDLCIGMEKPACVAACPNQALRLVSLEEEQEAKNRKAAQWLRYMV